MTGISQVRLGRTEIMVSRLAFGAGPVSGLMTGDDSALQERTVARALDCGINWFDTAAGYGQGRSETNLGRALQAAMGRSRTDTPSCSGPFHIATKVRVQLEDDRDPAAQILDSVDQCLRRLQRSDLTLLQLHNGMTRQRGDEPFSLSADEILRPGGIAAVLRRLKDEGVVRAIGLTGTGHPEAMRQVIRSEEFDTIQLPYNILNPSAGQDMPPELVDRNYGNILQDCLERDLGVFAIRVFAAGAVLGLPPSAHTLRTPFFPLDLYERDVQQSADLRSGMRPGAARRRALQFALSHPAVHCAIIGFGEPAHVEDAVGDLSGAND